MIEQCRGEQEDKGKQTKCRQSGGLAPNHERCRADNEIVRPLPT